MSNADHFFPSLTNLKDLTEIYLWSTEIDDKFVNKLTIYLKSLSKLKVFSIWGNKIGNDSISPLSEYLQAAESLDTFYLCSYFLFN